MRRHGPAVIAVLLLLSGSTNGCETRQPSRDAPRPKSHLFDARRAWALLGEQVRRGHRPAGSRALRRLAVLLRDELPHGRFEPVAGQPGLRNVVGVLPGRRPGIVLGAHYDTLADPSGAVGANNGAAGSAAVVETARALAAMPRPARAREVRFVLFDGEEPAHGLPEDQVDFAGAGLRGSRSYLAAHPRQTKAMLLLDYIANKGLRLPREGSSDQRLWDRVRDAARRAGVGEVFPDTTQPTITDDHTPFLAAGIPAVDLIDWSYDGHDESDRLDKLSPRSLDAVGETTVAVVEDLRAGR